MYAINPTMSYGEVVNYYEQYVEDMKKQGEEPVSFLHFLTGRS